MTKLERHLDELQGYLDEVTSTANVSGVQAMQVPLGAMPPLPPGTQERLKKIAPHLARIRNFRDGRLQHRVGKTKTKES